MEDLLGPPPKPKPRPEIRRIDRKATGPDLSTLLYWAKEREAIRLRRATKGARPPWTKDPILQTYRFCNVRRRDDRVSQWLINNVFRYGQNDPESFILFTALCRWINWPPTIQAILDEELWPSPKPNWREIGDLIDSITRSGKKAWTGAYMIRAKPGSETGKGRYVATEVVEESLTPALGEIREAIAGREAKKVWEVIQSRLYWGSFMAGQLVADWSYTPLLARAVDLYRWAPIGPGSSKGFNHLLGRPLDTPIDEAEWNYTLRDWRVEIIDALGGLPYHDLTLHDVQNCLCEYSKYVRVKEGGSPPRAKYQPETAY